MMRASFPRLLLAVCLAGVCLPVWADDAEVARRLADMQSQISSMDARIGRLESMLQNGAMLNLLSEVEALKSQVKRLRGDVDVQSNDISMTQKRQNDLYMDLDTRLRNLAHLDSAPAAPAATSGASDKAASAVPAQPAAGGDSARDYEAALNQFKAGNYPAAITAFKGFIKTYPDSALTPSAQYWIGNAYFSIKDYKTAIAQQKKLIASHPDSPKVPDAMLNISSAQLELGDLAAARKTLQTLIAKYPDSSASALAQKRLEALK
ncbi:tol-pal system protein YbgF [Sulfuriferula plumbiphila]|uniref:Cell division coordinator CpoB n=1 Tax=Sulfuriferula plumbiphila TaxID=171865 RepID=A0A512LAR7_9PROT|nr:tol-pal system protein YbgF [Sulfuriferula plumbiphila]BBP03351.1 tol-pal system protein YbgF [Sulfuriferula plumbiphila]GEP31567.1 tol-pal system protein YbgF [Sulfuriferula plumbiphila]